MSTNALPAPPVARTEPSAPALVMAAAPVVLEAWADRSAALTVRVQRGAPHTTLVRVEGEIDVAAAVQLERALLPLVRHGAVVLEAAGITMLGSHGLRVLLAADRASRVHGGSFRIAAPSPALRQVLDVTQVSENLEVFDRLDDALRA
jgi:anti-anti-sigma factor